ncbi:hypothetical protein PAPHI01_0769 [Pancytospora philotis]|nr:hypothetical protein PAPHI01_0769 [Pancytospora philotis]
MRKIFHLVTLGAVLGSVAGPSKPSPFTSSELAAAECKCADYPDSILCSSDDYMRELMNRLAGASARFEELLTFVADVQELCDGGHDLACVHLIVKGVERINCMAHTTDLADVSYAMENRSKIYAWITKAYRHTEAIERCVDKFFNNKHVEKHREIDAIEDIELDRRCDALSNLHTSFGEDLKELMRVLANRHDAEMPKAHEEFIAFHIKLLDIYQPIFTVALLPSAGLLAYQRVLCNACKSLIELADEADTLKHHLCASTAREFLSSKQHMLDEHLKMLREARDSLNRQKSKWGSTFANLKKHVRKFIKSQAGKTLVAKSKDRLPSTSSSATEPKTEAAAPSPKLCICSRCQ